MLRLNSSDRRVAFLVQRLQVVARGLVFVHAGQPIAQQRALNDNAGSPRSRLPDSMAESVVDLARFRLSALPAMATRCASSCAWSRTALSAGHGVEHPSLSAGQGELLDGFVIEAERVFRRSWAFYGQQGRKSCLVRSQASAHPGWLSAVSGGSSASLPGV
jgi:hypothetical protein